MLSETKKNPVFIILIILIAFVMVITFAASLFAAGDKPADRGYVDFSGGWLSESGDEIDVGKLPESRVIHKEIPVLDSDEVLSFNARNIDVDVYIDDECVYKTKRTDNGFLSLLYGRTDGSAFIEIPVLKEQAGKTLYISIINPYSNGTSCGIVNMFFGDGVAIVKHETSIELGAFSFSTLILVIGAVFMILYIPMAKHKLIDRSMLYLGIAAFSFGMMMITDSKMLHLIVGHETLYYTVSQIFMILTPIPLLLFFEKLYGDLNKKVIIAICSLTFADLAAVFTLNAVGVFDYHDNAFLILLIYCACIFYIGFITLKRLIKRDKDNLFHNIGVLMIITALVIDMTVTQLTGFATNTFTMFGITGFTIMECIQVLWKHIEDYQRGVKAQLVSRLAYHDGLTDMLNRTSFMEDMEVLEKAPRPGILIAVFDVNDLKYVNDNFGHAEGDELIMNAADAISKTFDDIGKCYRTGGDEFVLISEYPDAEKQFVSACTTLSVYLREKNAHSEYPLSIAVGYSVMREGCASLKDLLKEADEKMYENKRRMKGSK